jgi:hypothetical protein
MNPPDISFEDRVIRLHHNLTLIQAACAGAETLDEGEEGVLMLAIGHLAEQSIALLDPVASAIVAYGPPTDTTRAARRAQKGGA